MHFRVEHDFTPDGGCALRVPRRFVWNPTVGMAGRRRARWACGQYLFTGYGIDLARVAAAALSQTSHRSQLAGEGRVGGQRILHGLQHAEHERHAGGERRDGHVAVSYTHLTLPTNREV